MLDKKIIESADPKEFEEAFELTILTKLIELSNKLDNYQEAIIEVQEWLRTLIRLMPSKRDMYIRVSDKAGAKFMHSIGQAVHKNKNPSMFHRNESILGDMKFGNVKISQGGNDVQ